MNFLNFNDYSTSVINTGATSQAINNINNTFRAKVYLYDITYTINELYQASGIASNEIAFVNVDIRKNSRNPATVIPGFTYQNAQFASRFVVYKSCYNKISMNSLFYPGDILTIGGAIFSLNPVTANIALSLHYLLNYKLVY